MKLQFAKFAGRSLWPLLLALLVAIPVRTPAESIEIYARDTLKPMKQVVEDAEFSITDQNFRVVDKLHVGKAIHESGYPNFPDYEILLFCNVNYARRMLELDPDMINYCPGRVAVRQEKDKVIISAPLFPQHTGNEKLNDITGELNGMIRHIVDFASEPWPPGKPRPVHEGKQ